MNNTTKTSITLVAITFTLAMLVPAAQAHPIPTIMNYGEFDADDGTQEIWYDIYSLDYVTLDNVENNGAAFRLIAEVARASLNTSDMTVTETANWSWGDSVYDAKYYSSSGVYGATATYGNGDDRYKFIYLNTNNSVNYSLNKGCYTANTSPNPAYISNHEFGHFAGLNHHSGGSSHTAMHTGCHPNQYQIQSADFTDINNHYN